MTINELKWCKEGIDSFYFQLKMLNKVSGLVDHLLQYKLGYTWSVINLSFCLNHIPLVFSENSELLKSIETGINIHFEYCFSLDQYINTAN